MTKKYPELTPYQFASNRPIDGIDQDGLEWQPIKKNNVAVFYTWAGYGKDGKPVHCSYQIGEIAGDNPSSFQAIEKINTQNIFFEKDFPSLIDSNKHYCVKSEIYDSVSKHSKVFYGAH